MDRRTGKIREAFSRMHRALDGWMLARAPASPAQGLHHHGPRYFNFPYFCTMCGLPIRYVVCYDRYDRKSGMKALLHKREEGNEQNRACPGVSWTKSGTSGRFGGGFRLDKTGHKTKVDKTGAWCMADKLGHFPYFVDITGYTRVFSCQNWAYSVNPPLVSAPVHPSSMPCHVFCCLKKNQTTPRPSEHPPVMGGKMSVV